MTRKKIRNMFNDQSSEQYKNKTGRNRFFPIKSSQNSRTGFQKGNPSGVVKTFGDTDNDIFDPNSGINQKNYYVKQQLTNFERDNLNGPQSGSLVHPDLGNGFVVNSLNSDEDSLHHFSGFKKYIDLKLSYFSATFIDTSGSFRNVDVGLAATDQAWNNGIAISPIDGAVYVCGQEPISGSNLNFFVRKLDGLGGSQSYTTVDSYNGNANGNDVACSIAVSPVDRSSLCLRI